MSIIENIVNFRPKHAGTDISKALQYFNRIQKKPSVVFVISDFLDDGYKKDLKVTSQRHDLVLVRVMDRAEELIPAGAIFLFEDLETGETIELDNMKNEFRLNNIMDLPKRNLINIYTDEDYVRPLRQFFKRRGLR